MREIKVLERHSRVYFTRLGRHIHPDSNSSWEVPSDSNLDSQLGRVPGGASTPPVRLQIVVLGASVYNSRPQTYSISLRAKLQLWFNCKNAVDFTMWVTRFSRPQGTGQVSRAQEISRPTPFLIVHAAWLVSNNC